MGFIHPFIEQFERAPAKTLGDALRGLLWLPNIGAIDAPNLVARLFRALPPGSGFITQFNQALAEWLQVQRRKTYAEIFKLGGHSLFSSELDVAFGLVEDLPLPHSRAYLREHRHDYGAWVKNFWESDYLDPYFGFWMALTADQPDHALGRQWLVFARAAGAEKLPHRYLNVAAQGRQHQPWAHVEDQIAGIFGALILWATAACPDQPEAPGAPTAEILKTLATYRESLRWGDPVTDAQWRAVTERALAKDLPIRRVCALAIPAPTDALFLC